MLCLGIICHVAKAQSVHAMCWHAWPGNMPVTSYAKGCLPACPQHCLVQLEWRLPRTGLPMHVWVVTVRCRAEVAVHSLCCCCKRAS